MNRLTKWLAVLALVASVGGHWAVLQSVAWTTMLVRFSQTMPLTQALAYTFDGKRPCALCMIVQQGRDEQKKQDQQQANPAGKIEFGLVWQVMEFDFTCDVPPIPTPDFFSASDSIAPPKPPPRGLLPDNPTRV